MVKSKNRLFGDIATNVDATTGRIDSASLDSDIATTDTSSNFASGLQSGGVDVAADANLNSFLTAFNLPTADGSAGQYLKTDGSGTVGFESLPTNATTSADGFMSSSDKTKLDGVETGATADQTAAEIKTAYESNSDTNAFTDALQTKLNGVETSADVTDATNVAAAGAVMESDTTTANMSFVVDEDDMTSNSPTKLPTQQSVKAYVDTQVATKDALSELSGDSDDITQGSTNLFMTTAERSKLTGIETGATADQTAAEIEAIVSHDNLLDFVANEHIDWTTDQGATDIHINNIQASTTSVAGTMSSADKTKLDGIETGATADQTASEILTAIKTVDGASSGLDADLLDGNEATHFLNTSTSFGGDVSGTYNAIVIADDSHNHTISNVDNLQTTLDAKLALAGGTLTGSLVLHADPTASFQAATKQYVDTIASAGLHYHQPVRVEHPSNLNATYNNGSSGVGATLTNAGSNAAIELDGVALSLNDRVLVANQTNQAHNGVYKVTTVGDGSTAWVLTRTTDTDSYAPSDPDAFGKGDAFFIKEGDTNSGHLDVLSTSGTIVFGTTNIIFSEVAETTVYSAGTGLTLTGTTFAADQAIATTATPTFAGLTVNGNIAVTGNVDGRDVSADGTKLDGVETGATADQTDAEIKTAYENNSDTNAFTDALLTKLNGIEASATADQSASDIEAIVSHDNLQGYVANEHIDWTTDQGATNININNIVAASNSTSGLMASADKVKLDAIESNATADQTAAEIEAIVSHDNLLDFVANEHIDWTSDQGATNIDINNIQAATTSVAGSMSSSDKTKLDGIETGATANQTDAEIKTAYENNADTNAFTDALQTKLNGIETSADVTDATNVAAAGALMDSELTSEASVKAINQGLATTDGPSFTDVQLLSSATSRVQFGDTGNNDNDVGYIEYSHSNDQMSFRVAGTTSAFKINNSSIISGKNLVASTDTYDLGTTSAKWGNVHFQDGIYANNSFGNDGQVLTSDGSGNTRWEDVPSSGISTGKAIAMAMVFG